jgi:hypothetical protein
MIELANIQEDVKKEEDKEEYYLLSSSQGEFSRGSDRKAKSNHSEQSEFMYNKTLDTQASEFYAKNKLKFLKTTNFDPSKEQESFKEVLRFARRQSSKVELEFFKVEAPKFHYLELNGTNHMSKLAKLLESKNLRNYRIKNPEDSDYDDIESEPEEKEDDEDNQEEGGGGGNGKKDKIVFTNEVLAKRYNSINDKLAYRKKVLNYMYKKSATNQSRSKTYYDLSVLENNIASKRPKTSSASLAAYQNTNSATTNNTNTTSYTPDPYMEHSKILSIQLSNAIASKPTPRENIQEKTQFDVSRNFTAKSYPFKVIQNKFNSKIEVFRP